MLQIWHTVKGGVAAVVALIVCPCHLPITLPLLITLTAGTAFGVWLGNNTATVGIISTVIFVGGLALAFKWMTGSSDPASAVQIEGPKAKAPPAHIPASSNGMPDVTLITSSICTSCNGAKTIWEQARQQVSFQYQEIDITSTQGQRLAAKYNIFSTPVAIVNGKMVKRGRLSLDDALAMVSPATQTAQGRPQ